MKKLIFAMFCCTALMMASCEKNEPTTPKEPEQPEQPEQPETPVTKPEDVAGEYAAQTANVKVSGISYDMIGTQTIKVGGAKLEEMTVEVPEGIVPGEGKLTFNNVVFTAESTFTGSNVNNDRTISIKGHVHNKTLNVVITPEYKSELVGTYNFEKPDMVKNEFDMEEDHSQVMICKVETPSGKVQFFMSEQEQEYMDVFFNGMVGQMILRSYIVTENEDGTKNSTYSGALRNITFHADGNLTAEYNKKFSPSFMGAGGDPVMPEFVASPMYAMRWYVKGGKLFLVPNLNMMTRAGISQDGLALNLTMKDGKITVFADKTQVAPLMSLLNPVIQGLPDELLGDLSMIAKTLVGEIKVITEEATRFDLGICLEKTGEIK